MADSDETAERIRRSVASTADEGTARIRFTPHRDVGRSSGGSLAERSPTRTLAAFAAARRAVKRGLSVIPQSTAESGLAAGQIDFVRQRSVYNAGTVWRLTAPDRDFAGRPGGWEAGAHEGILLEEPFWLLEVVGSTVEAVGEGTEPVRGVKCDRYRTVADFTGAAAKAARRLASPRPGEQPDLTRLALDVWLDGAGRIRRADLHGVGSLTSLELFDFGEPLPIELPDPSELLPAPADSPTVGPALGSATHPRPGGEDV